jgi:hypothetical protein
MKEEQTCTGFQGCEMRTYMMNVVTMTTMMTTSSTNQYNYDSDYGYEEETMNTKG